MGDRRSIRLKAYDYSAPGMYYVVVRTRKGVCAFGEIVRNEIRLSAAGEIARKCWEEIPQHFTNAQIDQHIVMPNHVHGIVILDESLVRTRHAVSIRNEPNGNVSQFGKPVAGSLSTIVGSFKSAVTRRTRLEGFRAFAWLPRFYEHVIRDGKDIDRIREYILENPMNWTVDEEFPENIRMDKMYKGEADWSPLD